MKKRILIAAFAAVGGAALFLNSCSKDEGDTTAPVITLSGNNPYNIVLNGTAYSEPGASATDDKDGSVTVTNDGSSTNPNKDIAGTYTISYTATDAAGNSGHASRTVIVKNDAAYLEGSYQVIENAIDTFPQTITASKTVNNQIWFNKFANYANNDSITAMVSGVSILLNPSPQVAYGIGVSSCDHTFSSGGAGNSIVVLSSHATFSIKFNDNEEVGGASCPGTSPVLFTDVFVQQ